MWHPWIEISNEAPDEDDFLDNSDNDVSLDGGQGVCDLDTSIKNMMDYTACQCGDS